MHHESFCVCGYSSSASCACYSSPRLTLTIYAFICSGQNQYHSAQGTRNLACGWFCCLNSIPRSPSSRLNSYVVSSRDNCTNATTRSSNSLPLPNRPTDTKKVRHKYKRYHPFVIICIHNVIYTPRYTELPLLSSVPYPITKTLPSRSLPSPVPVTELISDRPTWQ